MLAYLKLKGTKFAGICFNNETILWNKHNFVTVHRVLYEYPLVFDLIAPCFLPATRISGEFSPLNHTTAVFDETRFSLGKLDDK